MYIFNSKSRDLRRFVKNVLLLATVCMMVLYVLCLGYKKWNRDDSDYTRKFQHMPERIAVANLGSSHGLYGFCYDNMEKDACFNFGLVSQSLDYDCRILEQYQDRIAQGSIVFVVVSYFTLYGQDECQKEDFVSKNKRYYKILSPKYIKDYSVWQNMTVDIFPIMGIEENVLFNLASGKERDENVKGIWSRALLDVSKEAVEIDAKETYQRHIADNMDENGNMIVNQRNVKALYRIIALCRERGANPVMVTTPYLHEYVDIVRENKPDFLDGFYRFIDEVQQKTGAAYYDYSCDEEFADAYGYFFSVDHLNREGALKFTERLWEESRH